MATLSRSPEPVPAAPRPPSAGSYRLYARFLALFVPVFLVCVTVATSHFVHLDGRKARDELAARVGSQTARVAAALARHVEAGDQRAVQDLLETLLSDRAIECATLSREGGAGPVAVAPEGLGCVAGLSLEAITIPITAESGGEMRLEARFTTEEVDAALKSRRGFTILAILASLVIALAASLVGFRVIIGQPLSSLLGAIDAAAAGQRPPAVPVRAADELGAVTQAFNTMQSRLATEALQRAAHIEALSAEIARRERTEAALIEARDQAEAVARQLEHLATHDGLTGLLERQSFEAMVSSRLASGESGVRALAYVDIDKFKSINDTHGHAAGDAVIRTVAERLAAGVGPDDLVCRVGGDEFLVYLERRADKSEPERCLAAIAADSNGRDVEVRVEQDGRVELLPITVSIGLVHTPEFGATLAELVPRADLALYRAKHLGRSRLCRFEPALEQERTSRMLVESELGVALTSGHLELHYQPIVDLDTGDIVAHEALMRWRHPDRGIIAPAEFLGIAERSGLSPRLCEWTIMTACRDAVGWPRPWIVAVNVSPTQLESVELPALVARILAETRLDPARLELEITEQVILDRGESTLAKIQALKALGVRVALDDFGAGYASLALLPFVAWDQVKVDRSFIEDAHVDETSRRMLSLIVDLCRSLRFEVTIEGIETPAQRALLADRPRLRGQGFLFGRPRRLAVAVADHAGGRGRADLAA